MERADGLCLSCLESLSDIRGQGGALRDCPDQFTLPHEMRAIGLQRGDLDA